MIKKLAGLAIALAAVASSAFPQGNPGVGSWSPTYDWTSRVVVTSNGQPVCLDQESEFSSAALIPTGFFAGSVIMWRKHRADNGLGGCVPINTTVTWIFDPSTPSTLIEFEQAAEINSDFFCSGLSWDRHGQLVVAGGVPTGGETGCEFPVETYRLRPENMEGVLWDLNTNLAEVYYDSGRLPWKRMGDMVFERYYPTVIQLDRNDTYTSQAHGSVLMAGGSSFCAGGPWCAGEDGAEFWEILEGKKSTYTQWYDPIIPVNPDANDPIYGGKNAPHYGTGHSQVEPQDPDFYVRPQPVADRLFDSYPRMFQLNDDDSRPILVCGDVDTAADGVNAPGSTWVIQPRISTTGSQTNWQLHKGLEGPDPVGSDIWHDSFYDTAVAMSELDSFGFSGPDRVFMFGGSRNTGGTSNWVANSKVWEFAYSFSGGALPGDWFEKPAPSGVGLVGDEFRRLYGNATWLPTGEVFFEGGSKVDDWEAHNGYTGGTCSETNPKQNPSTPNDVPIIFDPGANTGVGCTVYRQPENQEINGKNTARLYHHIALLLPDGRVLVAGGRQPKDHCGNPTAAPDPRFSGEVFSPPYLDFEYTEMSRPIASNLSATSVFFEDTFTFDVTRKDGNLIDRVVLIRPGAITHHWDNDQKYIELAFSVTSTDPDPSSPDATDSLLAEMPQDTVCSPGWYMLFAIESDQSGMVGHRVPSFAKFVRLK